MKSIIIGLGLLMVAVPSIAGPPADAAPMPFQTQVLCTPTMTSMVSAMTKDYAVHISMTFEASPEEGIVVVENPDTGTAAILHTMAGRTCLIFSGMNLRHFDRPEGMALPEVQINPEFQKNSDVGA